jgi:hypothetical protein
MTLPIFAVITSKEELITTKLSLAVASVKAVWLSDEFGRRLWSLVVFFIQ